jgi:ABC-type phosphate/phosphonate transport system substrate-binding protein
LDAARRRARGAPGDRPAARAVIAALPMYDWPELRPATDRYWARLSAALQAEGVPAPYTLTRDRPAEAVWRDPALVLAQTCGLPFVRSLAGRVTLIGAPDHAVPGCPAGFYRSAVVVRADDRRDRLAAFRGATFAANDPLSQSGTAAMGHHVAPLAEAGRFFGRTLTTGAHAASAEAVACGAADIASIDCVSWRLIRRFRPAVAGRLRVLMLTDPTPALPYITAGGRDPAPFRRAIAAAIAALDPRTMATLGLAGFVPFEAADYGRIAARADAAYALLAVG